jgi:hypothetical protein
MTPPNTFLVDTNSYVRIARSATCVLGDHAGLELRLTVEIADECSRSSRLHNVTPWILQPPHPKHREDWTRPLSKPEEKLAKHARYELKYPLEDTLEDFAAKKRARNDFRPVLSRPDKDLFFTAYALRFGVVTDEQPLTVACKEFEVSHMSTLELLRHLETHNVLKRAQIEGMVRYWQYEKDEPKQWRAQYRKLFGEPLPTLQIDGD